MKIPGICERPFIRISLRPIVSIPLLMLALSACVTGLPARGTVVMRDVSIPLRDFRLPSGLRVVVEEDRRSPVVAVVAVVNVGSIDDPTGREGLAHVVGHLSFRARHRGGSSVRTRLERLGAGRFNAVAHLDHTVYQAMVPRESLPAFLELKAQMLTAPLEGVTEQVFSVEREVLRNELRQHNETGYIGQVFHWVQEASFPADHPYARPILGNHDSLFRITLQDAQQFVRTHYLPENVTLVISGDVDLADMEVLLKKSLPKTWHGEGLPLAREPRLSPQAPEPPEPPKASELVRREGGVARPELYLAWVLPRSFDEASAVHDFVRSSVASHFYRPLFDDGDIRSISSHIVPGALASLLVVRVALYTGEDPERSAQAVLNQVYRAWRSDGGEEEVFQQHLSFQEKQRSTFIGLALESEDLLSRAVRRAELTHFQLDARAYSRLQGSLATLNSSNVTDFAYRWLQRSRARVLLVSPEKYGVPVLASNTGLPPDEVVTAPPRAPPPSMLTVSSSVTSLRLDNGLQVLLAAKPGLPLVTVGVALSGGEASARPGVAELADWVSYSRTQFEGTLGDYGLQYSRDLYDDHLRYVLAGAAGNVGNMLAILREQLDSVGTTSEVMQFYSERVLPFRKGSDNWPELQAYRAQKRALYGGHPYGEDATGEDVGRVTQSQLEDWLSKVHRPSNAVVVIAGEFDPQQLMPLVHKYLGGWQGEGKVELPPVPLPEKPGAKPAILITPRPEARQGRVQLACRLPGGTPQAAARHDLMASVLRSRLWYQVRDRMGATYGFYALVVKKHGGASHLVLEDVVDTPQLAVSLSAARAVLAQYAEEGIPAAELEHARGRLLAAHAMRLITSESWVDALLDAQVLGWGPEAVTERPALLQAVTSAEIQKDLAGCLRRMVVGIIGDDEKARTAVQVAFP